MVRGRPKDIEYKKEHLLVVGVVEMVVVGSGTVHGPYLDS